MAERISDETAGQMKTLLKTLIEETMKIEDKEARLVMLPSILEGFDMFELIR